MPTQTLKLVIFVPLSHTDIVREAMDKAGAGVIGNYTHCTFSTRGIGRFKPGEGAKPHLGEVGKIEGVEEERGGMHPYDEVAYDVYPLENM